MKFGFCCKYITDIEQINGIKPKHDSYAYNMSTTTAAHMNKLSKDVAVDKLTQLVLGNIASLQRLVTLVGQCIPEHRMLRIGSDILPLYTHKDWRWFYQQSDIQLLIAPLFLEIGNIARANDVRLSFHPGQYCVLASNNPDIVQRSIDEFEYHVDVVRWMGYGQRFQDIKVNVHLSGRGGVDEFVKSYHKLTPEARMVLTIENDEFSSSLEECLQVGNLVPIVFDIHHEWINTGNILRPTDPLIQRVLDSWRGNRPTMHYSQSRVRATETLDDMNLLLKEIKRTQLRAHSDFYHNRELNQVIKEFSNTFDIQCEAKAKNLARDRLYDELFVITGV